MRKAIGDMSLTNVQSAENELYWSQPQNLANLVRCQSLARRYSVRKEFNQVRDLHKSSLFESQITKLQAQARGVLARKALEDKRIMFENAEEWIINVCYASSFYITIDSD